MVGGGVLVAKHTFGKMHAHLECDRRGGYTTPRAPTACRCTSTMWFQQFEPCCLQDGQRLIHNMTTVYHINRLLANNSVGIYGRPLRPSGNYIHLAATSVWPATTRVWHLRPSGNYIHLAATSIWLATIDLAL